MFQFADPEYLYLLSVIPVAVLIYIYTTLRSRKRIERYGEPRLVRKLIGNYSSRRPWVKFGILLFALALSIVMLARPQYGLSTSTRQRQGIEAAVMIDVSNSMLATDIRPSRLEKAKALVGSLIHNMENDKIAFGVFAGDAYPQLPITNDHATANLFLDAVSTKMVTKQGTNLAAAIQLANNSFSDKKNVGKAIIIITDGESFEGDEIEAAKEAHEQGRQIFILGIGTQGGGQVMTDDGILTDSEGQPVVSKLNEELCQKVAKAADGKYIHVDNTSSAQIALQHALSSLKKDTTTFDYTSFDEQFQAVGLLILLLLLVEFFIFPTHNVWASRFHLFQKK